MVLKAAPQVLSTICPGHCTTALEMDRLSDEVVERLQLRVMKLKQSEFALHGICTRFDIGAKRLKMIQSILDSDTEVVSRKDKDGDHPLHLVATYSLCTPAAELLIAVDPKAPLYKDMFGDLPIHAMLGGTDDERKRYPSIDDPDLVGLAAVLCRTTATLKIKGGVDQVPIVMACRRHLSYVINTILDASHKDDSAFFGADQNPLYDVCRRDHKDAGSALSAVTKMIALWPELLNQPNVHLNLPLHAVFLTSNHDLQFSLAEKIMLAAGNVLAHLKHANRRGLLPLHVACEHSASVTQIEHMTELFRGALGADSKAGTPLHFAMLNKTKQAASIINTVMDSAPEATQQARCEFHTRDFDFYPLHGACERAGLLH